MIQQTESVDRKGKKVIKKTLAKPAWSVKGPHRIDTIIAPSGTFGEPNNAGETFSLAGAC